MIDLKLIVSVPEAAIDHKIVVALERVSQVVRMLAWNTGKRYQLNPIQMQILVFLLHHSAEKSKVSYLAKEFTISKASISDTVTLLVQKQLVSKNYRDKSKKSFIIQLTVKGREAAEEAASFAHELVIPIGKLPVDDKEKLFSILGNIILDLHQSGIIPVQRMCQTCRYYDKTGEHYHCKLLERNLNTGELQIDCNDHQNKL